MVKRCQWVNNTLQAYIDYHDYEWGVPIHNDKKHFEFLVLESAQAGLSWSTILKKREGYRKVYQNFNPEIVSNYNENDTQKLLNNPSIVRNRKKIEASINNAQCFIEVQNNFGSYDNFIWSFVDHKPIKNLWKDIGQVPSKTELSDKISKDLRKRGFRFLGSTIIYAYMQAVGLVNDHTTECFRYKELVN